MNVVLTDRKRHTIFWALELLTVAVGILFCLRGRQEIYYPAGDLQTVMGFYDETAGGMFVDEQSRGPEDVSLFTVKSGIRLGAGSYEVSLEYETDSDLTNSCCVQDSTVSTGNLWTSGAALPAGRDSAAFTVWLFEKTDTFEVQTKYGGAGYLLVKGIRVRRTGDMERMVTTLLFLFLVCVDCIISLRKRYGKDKTALNRIYGLGVICMVVSVPLMVNYLPAMKGEDLLYHLFRIEGVRDGLLAGQFPVRMYPEWLMGHGYADSVMYGKLLLYVPAVFRLLGFPVLLSYKLYVFLVNVATCLTAYCCFGHIFEDKNIGLFASLLYTTAPYRLYCVYYRASVGEYSAMIFLPVLCFAFYKIFTEDVEKKVYKRNWLSATVGFTGILQTHILSCELVGGFVLITCLLLWKKVLRKNTFLVLVKTVAATVCLNLYFLVPFLEYLCSGTMNISHSNNLIQGRGLYPAHLFLTGTEAGENGPYMFGLCGMQRSVAATVGPAGICAAFVFVWLLWSRIGKPKVKWVRRGRLFLVLALLAVFMSTRCFPWDSVQKVGGIVHKLISGIQFPMRFLGIAAAFLVMVACASGCIIAGEESVFLRRCFFGLLAVIAVAVALRWQNDLLRTADLYRIYDLNCVGTSHIMGREYLPVGADTELLRYSGPTPQGVEIEQYRKKYLRAEFTCSSEAGGYVELPMLCYKGYAARDAESGLKLQVEAGNNFAVRVIVPAGFEGRIEVDFEGMWYWRAAELFSLFSLIAVCAKSLLKPAAS